MIKLGSNNLKLKEYRGLLNNDRLENQTISDDLSSIRLAFDNNVKVLEFLYCDDLQYHPQTWELIKKISSVCPNIYITSYRNFQKLAQKENAVGILAVFELNILNVTELAKYDLVLVLDQLEIPGNIGTLFRSVEACGKVAVVLCDSVVKYNNVKITQSARGANIYVPTVVSTYEDCQKWLLDNNYTIYLGEPSQGLDYQKYHYDGKTAIVIGNERFGINNRWYAHRHLKVHIPMEGSNNSLNVAVAGSILLFEAKMKRKVK